MGLVHIPYYGFPRPKGADGSTPPLGEGLGEGVQKRHHFHGAFALTFILWLAYSI